MLLLAACSKGPEADLPAIGEARSLLAEWALVNQLAGEDKLTIPYVATMRNQLRKQLRSSASSLTRPDSAYAGEIRAALREPGDAPPILLRKHAEKLKAMETTLESA